MKNSKTNNVLIIISYLLVCIGLQAIFPWYIIVVCTVVAAYFIESSPIRVISLFFFLGFIMWALMALFIDSRSNSTLSTRVGVLFGNQTPVVLIVITGLISAISSALGAWFGSQLRLFIRGK